MEKFEFIEYMLDCAIRLKVIGHLDSQQRFFRISGISQLEELLSSLPSASTPALLVENNTDGRVGDTARSDNFLDTPYYVFYVIMKAPFNNHDKMQEAKEKSKQIGFKILSRMLHDRRNYQNGLIMFDFSSVSYQSIGPVGDNCFGTMFSFSVANQADLAFKNDDWLPQNLA